jgi:nucleotide-binding universal stress UspA family protein
MPFGVVVPAALRRQIEEALGNAADVDKDGLVAEFRTRAARMGLVEQGYEKGKATARFIEYEGKQAEAVRHFGRLADLICVPQPDTSQNLGFNTLKTALFSTGRPVMMCPSNKEVQDGFADDVAIAWNGSLEATRAVALAMPLIAAANSVTVLTTGDTGHDPAAWQLLRYLELKGVAATERRFTRARTIVGRQLLEETVAAGAGTLIMGAYHDSYERESIFGGNSHVVVKEAEIPVVFVH